jgi:hypothetical protein
MGAVGVIVAIRGWFSVFGVQFSVDEAAAADS